MKILVIGSAQRYDANFNIVNKFDNELRKNGIEVHRGYCLTLDSIKSDEFVNNGFIVQDKRVSEFDYVRDSIGWMQMATLSRIKYLLRNPQYILGCTQQVIDENLYMKSAAKNVDRYCIDNGIDAVIGVIYPYTVAKLVASMKYPGKKYIYQLDPHTYNPVNSEKNKKHNLKEEKWVFTKISKLFTNRYIKKDLLINEPFKNRADDIVEVEFPLIEKDDNCVTDKNQIIKELPNNQVSFLHAGRFYGEIRNPQKLAELFQKLPSNYILYLAGSNVDDTMRYFVGMEDRVVNLGVLSQEEARKARQEADFLISYNNLVVNMVPSKLFECINTGRPFINLCQIHNCPTLDYVKDYKMAHTIFTDEYSEDKIHEFIGFVEEKRGCVYDKNKVLEKYGSCTVEYVTGLILNEIKDDLINDCKHGVKNNCLNT